MRALYIIEVMKNEPQATLVGIRITGVTMAQLIQNNGLQIKSSIPPYKQKMGKNPTSQITMSMDASGLMIKSFSCSTVKNGARA